MDFGKMTRVRKFCGDILLFPKNAEPCFPYFLLLRPCSFGVNMPLYRVSLITRISCEPQKSVDLKDSLTPFNTLPSNGSYFEPLSSKEPT